MGNLRQLLSRDDADMTAIEDHLSGLASPDRVTEVRSLERPHQRKLFDVAKGYRPISLSDLVPKDHPAMTEVVHHGKNSLPALTHFAKVFIRPASDHRNELWGYNRASAIVETIVGPGYFVVHPHEVAGEVLVDYLRVPTAKPAHWPKILPNDARLSFFVYNGTQDVLRGVSKHVSIGRATKRGKPMDAWFVLCRESTS